MRIFIAVVIILTLTFLGLRNIVQEDTSDLQRFAQGFASYENGTLIELGSAYFFDILSLEPINDYRNIFKLIILELLAVILISRRKDRKIWADLVILTVLFPYIFCINLKYIGVLFIMLLFSNFKSIKFLSFLSIFFHASIALPLSIYFLRKSKWIYKIIFFIFLFAVTASLAFYFERYLEYFVLDQKVPIGLLFWALSIIHLLNRIYKGFTASKILIVISIILLPLFITLAGRIILLALLFSLFENNYKNRIRFSYVNSFELIYFFSYGIYQFIYMTGIL